VLDEVYILFDFTTDLVRHFLLQITHILGLNPGLQNGKLAIVYLSRGTQLQNILRARSPDRGRLCRV
jgi:hypothetical protein